LDTGISQILENILLRSKEIRLNLSLETSPWDNRSFHLDFTPLTNPFVPSPVQNMNISVS
jgi:hypothetical protein